MGLYDAYLAKVQAALDAVESKDFYEDPETKARYIRTPAGEARYGGKIGDLITEDMVARSSSTSAVTAIARSRASNIPRTVNTRAIASAAQRRRATEQRDRTRAEGQGKIREAAARRQEAAKAQSIIDRVAKRQVDLDKAREDQGIPTLRQKLNVGLQQEIEGIDLSKISDKDRAALAKALGGIDRSKFSDGANKTLDLLAEKITRDSEPSPKRGSNVPFDEAMGYGEFAPGGSENPSGGLPDPEFRLIVSSYKDDGRRPTRAQALGMSEAQLAEIYIVGLKDNELASVQGYDPKPSYNFLSWLGKIAKEKGLDGFEDDFRGSNGKYTYEPVRFGNKWDDLDIEIKDAMGALVEAGTHEWVEDPDYDGVEGLVEVGSMKALAVIYRDGTVDLDHEFKARYIRTPAGALKYGGKIGDLITADMEANANGPKG